MFWLARRCKLWIEIKKLKTENCEAADRRLIHVIFCLAPQNCSSDFPWFSLARELRMSYVYLMSNSVGTAACDRKTENYDRKTDKSSGKTAKQRRQSSGRPASLHSFSICCLVTLLFRWIWWCLLLFSWYFFIQLLFSAFVHGTMAVHLKRRYHIGLPIR